MMGCALLNGPQWKDWNGRMVVTFTGIGIHGTPVSNCLDVLNISADGASATRTTVSLPMPAGRFRSVVQGPDGSMYASTDTGEVYQLKPN
jgi:glucose/arabinose dehydrogenase